MDSLKNHPQLVSTCVPLHLSSLKATIFTDTEVVRRMIRKISAFLAPVRITPGHWPKAMARAGLPYAGEMTL
jgi:hypothetical protein